jgi:3-oxoacyl-[acyl-carrier-protein] synthase-3
VPEATAPDATVTVVANEVSAPTATLRGSAVASVGAVVPDDVMPNGPIADRLGVDEEWIAARTGIRERRVAPPSESLTSYAAEASRRALAGAGVDAAEVDLLLVATMSHDHLTPHASALVAAEIGAERAGAMDVNAACSGFLSALTLAGSQIESRRVDTALVIGADLLTRLTDRDDRATAALFGDGAGAVVVRPSENGGRMGPFALGADGARAGLITTGREEGVIRMKGPDTFRQAVDRLAQATLDATLAAGRQLDEIDLFAYHQANARILTAVRERLSLDPARVIECIEGYGNTSAASIPMALAEAQSRGMLAEDSTVLCAAFGGGLSWAATVIEWGMGDDA